MPDLGKTNAEWERLLEREFGMTILAPLRALREMRDAFRLTRTQVWVINDVDANVDPAVGVTLAGVDPGVNCTSLGRFYVRVTGAGPYTVSLYDTTGGGGGDLMASGTAAASATATLTASNSSGVTGTWGFPGTVTVTTDDSVQVQAKIDYLALLPKVYTEDGTVEDDPHSRSSIAAAYASVASSIESAIASVEAAAFEWAIASNANPTARGNDFARANETTLAADVEESDSDGNVSRVRTGLLERLKLAMAEETTGATQFVIKRTVSAAAATAASTNTGVGTIASHTPREKCPAGRVTFKAETGVDTGNLGEETFSGFFYADGTDRPTLVDGLRVGRSWSGPLGLGPITLNRTLAKTGDVGSDTDLGVITGFSVTGEKNANSDEGTYHWQITANASNWDLAFYKSSSLSASSLVAQVLNVATAAAFTATTQNGSGVEITGTIGSGPTTLTSGTLDLQPFRVENSNGVPDEFEIVVTVTDAGLYQTILSEHFSDNGSELNSTTSGSETISDDFVRVNTFFGFAVEDN